MKKKYIKEVNYCIFKQLNKIHANKGLFLSLKLKICAFNLFIAKFCFKVECDLLKTVNR